MSPKRWQVALALFAVYVIWGPTCVNPVVAVGLGALLLGEPMTGAEVLAMLLLVLACVVPVSVGGTTTSREEGQESRA